MQVFGRHYQNGEPIRVTLDAGRIQRVDPVWPNESATDWPWIAPGLFDLQINGHSGTWFSQENLTADDVCVVVEKYLAHGVTRLCPTLITNSYEALRDGFSAVAEACERHDWVNRMVPGCHLEGPYISAEDGPRGAHPLEHVRAANWDEFAEWQKASGNRIRLVTVAPDQENVIPFIRQAVESGVVISIGHTGASPEQIQAAVDAGATKSTHLGNGAHGTLKRHPNYLWEQLGDSRLWAGIITDGHHLPPSVVRSIIAAKGVDRTIITCDASGLAGCPPGVYQEGAVAMEVLEDGRLVVAGQRQYLAGSGQETDHCVATAMKMAPITLGQAVDMTSRNPALLLGYEECRLRRGSRADLVLFHWQPGGSFDTIATFLAGELKYGDVPELSVCSS